MNPAMNPAMMGQLGGVQPMNNPLQAKYKTSLCRHFQTTGTCSMGLRCHFAHGQNELRSPNDPLDLNPAIQNDPTMMVQQLSSMGMTNFKTIKCRYYELGICKYSEGCHFAHGDNDSKAVDQSSLSQMMLVQQYAALLQQQEKLKGETQEIEEQEQQQVLMQQQQAQGQPQGPSYNVQKDPTVQQEITMKQLKLIISEIKQLSVVNDEDKVRIQMAEELLGVNNITGASYVLDDVLCRSEASEEKREQFDEIINQASELAVNLMAEFTVKVANQQAQMKKQQDEFNKQAQEQAMKAASHVNLLDPSQFNSQQQPQDMQQHQHMQVPPQQPGVPFGVIPPTSQPPPNQNPLLPY